MAEESVNMGYTAFTRTLKKWNSGRTPKDGDCDEYLQATYFTDSNGLEVTDKAKIVELTDRLNVKFLEIEKDNGESK